MIAPVTRAAIERSRGNHQAALELLESVRQYDMSFLVGTANNYIRGQLYLHMRKGTEASNEFQRIIDQRGVEVFAPSRSLAYLGIARATAVTGDVAASRKAYQDFFALWKDADPGLEVLSQARKEYESLAR